MNRFTNIDPLSFLVIEDNFGDFVLLKESIYLSTIPATEIRLAETMQEAAAILNDFVPDVIFIDLYLPDSSGLDSFLQLKKHIGSSAVIVLSGISDTKTALEAITNGAQDYLAKGEFDSKLLEKTIIYAVERRRSLESLHLANERYRLVTKATNDLIWDWDIENDTIFCDEEAALESYGIVTNGAVFPRSQWIGRIHPEDSCRIKKLITELHNQPDNNFFEVEYRFRAENGDYKVVVDRGYVVRNQYGKATRVIGAAKDITKRRKLEKELQKSQVLQQRAITEATIRGQENEREQLGIELHDNITQILATSKLYLDYACAGPEIKKDIIIQSKNLIIQATEELRKLSHSLLPPSLEEFGLSQAMHELANSISCTGVFTIEKKWDDFQEKLLHHDQKLTIYRIVQEQLNNIIKHAKARQVLISLSLRLEEDGIILLIADNGKGFDTTQTRTGVGLRNITSRAELFGGQVTIASSPGQGCELKVLFPVNYSNTQS